MDKESGKGNPSTTIPFHCRTFVTQNEVDHLTEQHISHNNMPSSTPSSTTATTLLSSTTTTTSTSYQEQSPQQQLQSTPSQQLEINNEKIDDISNDLTKVRLEKNPILIIKNEQIGESNTTTNNHEPIPSTSIVDLSSSTNTTTTTITTTKKPLPMCVKISHPTLSPLQQQHIRNLPKTQSLDLADDRTDDAVSLTSSKSSESEDPNDKGTLPKFDQSSRPIYPNVPYSPYGSPYGSPRSGRRRPPLRESRRISIEQTGSFLQLNQYKLMDQIGQVGLKTVLINLM